MDSATTSTADRLAVAPVGLPHPLDRTLRIRAVLFDVDGTLYRQTPIRAMMTMELLTLPLLAPLKAAQRWRTLAAYRRAQEHLRQEPGKVTRATQVAAAAGAGAGLPLGEVEPLIEEWMFERPLKYLPYFKAAGLRRLLDLLDRSGVRTGVLTDYPAGQKLRALGLAERFPLVLCATDPDIGRFKPDPRGFLRACERWQLNPRDVLMVGDRVDVDAAGAAAAGMTSVIIGRHRGGAHTPVNCLRLPSFERLHDVLASGS